MGAGGITFGILVKVLNILQHINLFFYHKNSKLKKHNAERYNTAQNLNIKVPLLM